MTRTITGRLDALEATAVAAAMPASKIVVLDWIEPGPMPAGNFAMPDESTEAVADRLGIAPTSIVRVTVRDMRRPATEEATTHD